MIDYQDHALLLNESYRHWVGEYLVKQQDPGEVLSALNTADFVVLSHGIESDPVFNYGNLQALSLFGYEHLAFLQLPSRCTFPESNIADGSASEDVPWRETVDSSGLVTITEDTRITRSGREFVIDRGVLWKLIDNLGRVHGHATRIEEWHFLDEQV